MLTTHLPAGHMLARTWPGPVAWSLPAALFGSVLPDFELGIWAAAATLFLKGWQT